MPVEFAHLHNHTAHSLLDGVPSVDELVKAAKTQDMTHVALTDHGVITGEYDLYCACQSAGMKPVMGLEAYLFNPYVYVSLSNSKGNFSGKIRPEEMAVDVAYRAFEQAAQKHEYNRKHHHVLLLALNQTGLVNLHRLASFSHLDGFYYRPSLTHKVLEQYSDGIFVTSGCLAAEVPQLLVMGLEEEARNMLEWYRHIFPGRFAIEIQDHSLTDLAAINPKLVSLARERDIPLVATNDVHYIRPEDKRKQEILVAMGTIKGDETSVELDTEEGDGKEKFKIHGEGYHLRTVDEMRAALSGLDCVDEMLENAAAIAREVNYATTVPVDWRLPKVFPDLIREQKEAKLREMVETGARARYGEITPVIQERIDHELAVISEMGFPDYFFIVWDIIRQLKEWGELWNVRGSGGGSIVLYCMGATKDDPRGISDVDPIRHGLVFERFLNKSRVTLPDVDIDIPADVQKRVFQYLQEKYGEDRVARILTPVTMKLKSAIRDAARLYGVSPENIDKLSKRVPNHYETVEELRNDQEFMRFAKGYIKIEEILAATELVTGRPKARGTHPAGAVVSPEPLNEFTAMHKPTSANDDNAIPPIQLDMAGVENAKMLKVDLLSLNTLVIIRETLRLIERRYGKKIAYSDIPFDYDVDPAPYKLFQTGDTTGIFQFGSGPMRDILRRMNPTDVEQIIAVAALYRPGPMDYMEDFIKLVCGEQEPDYYHPQFEPILKATYGIVVYQEQLMQMLQVVGFSGVESDNVRRAISKKKLDKMEKYSVQFFKGCKERLGLSDRAAKELWDKFLKFAGYGFNRSHAASYGVLGAKTAWLKYHHRQEFLEAAMNAEYALTDNLLEYIADARLNGIRLLPPDVNKSDALFKRDGDHIRFGLLAIKNVKGSAISDLVAEREKNGPFNTISDLLIRVQGMDTATQAALLLSGAFDCFAKPDSKQPRADLLELLPKKTVKSVLRMGKFGEIVPDHPALWLQGEYEVLRTFVSNHPILMYLQAAGISPSRYIFPDHVPTRTRGGQTFMMIGIVRDVFHQTAKHRLFFDLEGFNPPAQRVSSFDLDLIDKSLPRLHNDYLAEVSVFKNKKGYLNLVSVRSIGHIYAPITYLSQQKTSSPA